jgi:hypothetical protein
MNLHASILRCKKIDVSLLYLSTYEGKQGKRREEERKRGREEEGKRGEKKRGREKERKRG